MKHLNIKIYGRVQGVNFRYSAAKKAVALGIKGFARNESDESLYIEAEGEEGDLKKFLVWCRKGPWLAAVEYVEEEWVDELENFNTFEVI